MAAKVAGEFKKSDILFAHGMENADGGTSSAGQPDDGTSRAAELALQRLRAFGGEVEMLLEKLV
jgi:hypothetical protein